MADLEEKSEKTTSVIGDLSGWSRHLVSLVREEVRPFAVLLIILLAGLFFLSRAGLPQEGGPRIVIWCLGGAISLVVLAGVFMTFLISFSRRGKPPESAAPDESTHSALTPEERGVLTMCIAAERGRLKGTSSRHISKPIKVRQKTVVSTFQKMLK